MKFQGKTIANEEADWKRKQLAISITTIKLNPLLNLGWMKELVITLDEGKNGPKMNHLGEHRRTQSQA